MRIIVCYLYLDQDKLNCRRFGWILEPVPLHLQKSRSSLNLASSCTRMWLHRLKCLPGNSAYMQIRLYRFGCPSVMIGLSPRYFLLEGKEFARLKLRICYLGGAHNLRDQYECFSIGWKEGIWGLCLLTVPKLDDFFEWGGGECIKICQLD